MITIAKGDTVAALAARQRERRVVDAVANAQRVLHDVEEDDDTRVLTDVEELLDLFGDALFPYTHLLSTDTPPPLPPSSSTPPSTTTAPSGKKVKLGARRSTPIYHLAHVFI